MGAPPDRLDHLCQRLHDGPLTQRLMGKAKSPQDVFIKEMAKGPMAHVMEQTGKAQQFLYIEPGGDPILKHPF